MRWKTAQKKTKLRGKIKLAVFTLILLLALLLTNQLVRAGKGFISPLTKLQSSQRLYHWDGTFNLNLVLLSKPLSVLSLNPMEYSVKIIEIPDDTYLEVPGGFGSWRAGAIFALGESGSPPQGVKLLKGSLSDFLGLPIDGFLEIRQQATGSSEQMVGFLRGNPWNTLTVLPNLRTDLTPFELMRFYWDVRGVRFDKIATFSLSQLGLLSPAELADGTKVYVGDPAKIDALITANFQESKILSEAATIAVFNATKRPGLAAKTAQLITHLGGNVIIQSGLEDESPTSVSGGKDYPFTTKRLRQLFVSNCPGRIKCDILGATASAFSRASVNLIIGQ